VEFFPEEGKYHYDGLRASGICWHPEETARHHGICPLTGKPVTIGVMARVEELADHPAGRKSPKARPYFSLIPLTEIIADTRGVGSTGKMVQQIYHDMLRKLGNEYFILMDAPIENIARSAGAVIAEGIQRMRDGKVRIRPGYDGVFGEVGIFTPEERVITKEQLKMFTP
jgi:PHP family Zn ribbon phosphoesterase